MGRQEPEDLDEDAPFYADKLIGLRSAYAVNHPVQGSSAEVVMIAVVPAIANGIAHAIEHRSEDVLQVEHGSLYPALHRLEVRGWIASFWGTSENNRRARYYRLTPAGRKQLAEQTGRWDRLVRAVNQVLRPAAE